MRFIQGVIVGAVLVIGAAYVHDNMIGRPVAQQVVDWDKVTGLFSRRAN